MVDFLLVFFNSYLWQNKDNNQAIFYSAHDICCQFYFLSAIFYMKNKATLAKMINQVLLNIGLWTNDM